VAGATNVEGGAGKKMLYTWTRFFSPGCICFFYLKYILNIFKNVRKKSNKNIVCISMS
jgi:hypothetical protein